MNETLLPLALRAVDGDKESMLVLADAMLESGWWHPRLTRPGFSLMQESGMSENVRFWPDAERGLSKGKMTTTRARGIAAALLFGDWSEEMWPVVRKCDDSPWVEVDKHYKILWRYA